MSGSPVFESAWRLLKDYDFVGHLPQEYYSTLPDRMAQLIESGDTLEHVNLVPTDHYNKRIRQRYNSDQALPPEFQKRGMKKYRFTLEAILNFMANDLARNHPELLETMSEPKRAGDPKYPDMPPSMMFDAMYTDDPKVDESEKRRGLSHRVSPHFVLNDEGKLQLATVGHGKLSDKKKQNIQVVPTTSLLNDMHDNSAIDERLPNRFDFLDRGNPDMPEMPVEEESPLPQTFSPQEKDYSNLPPAYREAARLADEQKNASEPMDIAMRLLKRELSEMTDYEIDRARFANDNTELQSEERTRAMDRMAEYARMNHPPAYALEEMFGEQVADAHDKVGDYDHADYFGDSIDPNEMHQYILENAGEEAAQNYINMYRMYRSQYGGNQASMSQLDQYGLKNDRDLNDFVENRESLTEDLDSIMPSDESVFDAFPYPEGTEFINHLSPPFTSTPENESNFQMKYASEPMDIALRLLKAKYLDENMSNVLYGEQDPVAQPVVEEPPHAHSIEGDNELKRRQRQQAMTSFSPLAGMVNQINPHTNQDRITELKQQAEQNVVGDQRSESKLFPISSMPPKYREDLTPDEQYDDYYSRFSTERPDRVKPQELNDEAREKFPLKFTSEPMDIAMRLLKEQIDYENQMELAPHEQLWNDEADEHLKTKTNELFDYAIAQGIDPGDLLDAWHDRASMVEGLDYGEPGSGLGFRAHAVDPSQWKKLASEPMNIAMRLLKNFVLEPDNPEQAYFNSSMGYHPETGKIGYVPNTEVDHLNDVRINLASPKQFMLRDRDGNPVDDGAGFDQFVQRVGKDLLHEHTHGAIDREIRQAYKDKILPSENVFSAHEVGAIAAQNPGEEFANQRGADRVSENETQHHPSTRDWRAEQSPFADGRWSPQPAYSSNSEEGYK